MNRLVLALATLVLAASAEAACMNKFLSRTDGARQVVTLLTGKLTFQEAQKLSTDIAERKAPPLEWVDDSGKTISKQFGELKVVRPMPVGCDDKPSGVIMIATFATVNKPSRLIKIKLGSDSPVDFEQQ